MPVKCESCGHEHEGWIPKTRLDKMASKLREAEQAAEAEAARVADLETQAKSAGKAAKELEAAAERIAQLEAGAVALKQERAIVRAGITDDEGLMVVRSLYSALPEDQRPASVEEWLGSDSLPRAVRAYLPETPAAPAGDDKPADQPAAETAPKPRPASPSRSVVPGEPSASGSVDLLSLPDEELAKFLERARPV